MNCESCKYFDKFAEHDDKGCCRRYSPRLTVEMVDPKSEYINPFRAAWPEVEIDDWCGEYER